MSVFLIASLVYVACVALVFHTYLGRFTTDLIGPPEDNVQDFWNTWYSQVTWDAGAGDFFHTTLIKFPEGVSLHLQSFAYSNLLLIFGLRKIFALSTSIPTLVGLHNAMLLLSFYLAAIGAFYLTRRYTRHTVSALFGGFIFAFSPFHVAHALHHMHVATVQYIPFFVLCFLNVVEEGKRRYLVGCVALYALSALSCWYYLFYIGYFLAFYYVYKAVEERTWFVSRLFYPTVANVAGVAVLLSPVLLPMIRESLEHSGAYAPGHDFYVADALGYLVPPPDHLLSRFSYRLSRFSHLVYRHFSGNAWEMMVYLGLANLALFAWAFVNRRRLHIQEAGFLLWGIIIFAMFAGGVHLHILGMPTIPLPTGVTQYLPLVRHARVPSRAVVFVYLFLAVGVGLAIRALWTRCARQPARRAVVLGLLAAGIFLDFYPTDLESTPVECPPAYDVITQDRDRDFGILDLPRGYYPGNMYMTYQSCHGRPIVVASVTRELKRTLNDTLETSDPEVQRRQLRESRVKYIVVHTEPNWNEYWRAERPDFYKANYPLVYADERNMVFRVY